MKTLIALVLATLLAGCVCEGPASSKRTGESFYPVKVCSIGDTDGSTCVDYAAKSYQWGETKFRMHLLNGQVIELNSGWAIIVTAK